MFGLEASLSASKVALAPGSGWGCEPSVLTCHGRTASR